MAKLSQVVLTNYRSCRSTTVTLADMTALVGRNNVGKSNVMDGICWLLRPASLAATDFCDTARRVVIEGLVSNVEAADMQAMDSKQATATAPYIAEGSLRFRRLQEKPEQSRTGIKLQVLPPDKWGAPSEDDWKPAPTGLPEGLSTLFPEPILIGAMENVSDDCGNVKAGTTIGKLIKAVTTRLAARHGDELKQSLSAIGAKLAAGSESRSPELAALDKEATQKLVDLFPGLEIAIHIPTPEFDELLKGGTVRAREVGDTQFRPIESMGHGAQRSIQMALVRQLAETVQEPGATKTILLVDEPELYLHPQGAELVMDALRRLARADYQVVYATHSPLTLSSEYVADTVILRKDGGSGTTAAKTARKAVEQCVANNRVQAERLLDDMANAKEVFFSDNVLVVEGRTERQLLPSIFMAMRGKSIGASKAGLADLGGGDNTAKALEVLNVMDIRAIALADFDFAFRGAVRAGLIAPDDESVKAAKNWFASNSTSIGCMLDDGGLPCRGGGISPADAFAAFAATEPGRTAAAKLHEQLLHSGIWLWKLGTVENHLGLKYKNPDAWAAYRLRLQKEHVDQVVSDVEGVRALFDHLIPM